MKPSYIILTESGERLDLCNADEFNPNEYAWKNGKIGFFFSEDYPNESYCFTPDQEDDPITAHTILFRAYDESGNIICTGSDHVTQFWL